MTPDIIPPIVAARWREACANPSIGRWRHTDVAATLAMCLIPRTRSCETCKHADAWKSSGYPCTGCIGLKLWAAKTVAASNEEWEAA